MNAIKIKKLTVKATHGVLAEEKIRKQPFCFDITMYTDFYSAYETDGLDNTVNYDEACNLIAEVAENNSYNLIEKLAYECAFVLLEKYENINRVELQLSKPDAPVNQDFEDISVFVDLKRTVCYLSLGSSIGDKKASLDFALEELDKVRGIKVRKVSSYISTRPYGGAAKNEFLNCAVEIETVLSPFGLLHVIHEIENKGGRKRDVRWGDRTLDIDIVFFGNQTICLDNLIVPHPDYENRSFVLVPLKEIAPNFICPLNGKRIKDFKV